MNPSEKICPVCNNKNEPEAIVCKHCGASLNSNKYANETPKAAEIKVFYSEKPEELHIDEAIIPSDGIIIYFAETTKPFAIRTEKEFIIGRRSVETPESILDLSDFDGFKMGMSRRHAMIRRTQTGYEVIDLSSTNGTWVNDQRLVPYRPYPLISGSLLRLSRIRLFVYFRSESENKKT